MCNLKLKHDVEIFFAEVNVSREICHLNLSFGVVGGDDDDNGGISYQEIKKRRRFSVGSHFSSYSTPLADKRHERSEKTNTETEREHGKKCGKWYALRWLRHTGE